MGILVICSYKIRRGCEAEARRLLKEHMSLLRRHGLVTDRPAIQGKGAAGTVVEIFEWESAEKSRLAPSIPEIGAHWKAMAEAMNFTPLALLPEALRPFANFTALD